MNKEADRGENNLGRTTWNKRLEDGRLQCRRSHLLPHIRADQCEIPLYPLGAEKQGMGIARIREQKSLHIRKRMGRWKEWGGGDTIEGTVGMLNDIDRENVNVRGLIAQTKIVKGKTRGKLSKGPKVVTMAGRVKVALEMRERKMKKELGQINQCTDKETLRETLKGMDIWRVSVKEAADVEDKIPTAGWCGYLAIDQIRRGLAEPNDLNQTG